MQCLKSIILNKTLKIILKHFRKGIWFLFYAYKSAIDYDCHSIMWLQTQFPAEGLKQTDRVNGYKDTDRLADRRPEGRTYHKMLTANIHNKYTHNKGKQ